MNFDFVGEALTILAQNAPVELFGILVFAIQAHSNTKAQNILKETFNKSVAEIKDNYEKSLEIIKTDNNIAKKL